MPELIEREVFKNTKRKVNQFYKRSVRKICFKLKNETIKNDLMNGQVQIDLFCKDMSQFYC